MNQTFSTKDPGLGGASLRRPLLALAQALLLFSLSACATPVPLHQVQPEIDLVWPAKPEKPRIQWVKAIKNYADAGISKGFWTRALEFFIGGDDRRIVRPHGLLYDDNDRLIIADPGARVVHCMDSRQGVYTVIGEEPNSPLRTPIGVAEDDHGRLYITDSTSGTVYRYDFAGRTLAPFVARTLKRPTGIAWDRVSRLLYIVETGANQVIAVDEQGVERVRFGVKKDGTALFNHPTDIAVDTAGKLYVTDPLNYRIRVFSSDGQLLSEFGRMGDSPGDLNKPKGVAVDSEGHIFVNDSLLDAVQIFDGAGAFLLPFGQAGVGKGDFWMPSGIWIDRQNYIFVADTYNQRVQVFRFLSDKGGKQEK